MTYSALYRDFVAQFPQYGDWFAARREGCTSGGKAPGIHISFGMIVVPFVSELLRTWDKPSLIKAFQFFEEMAEAPQPEIREVLEGTVLVGLLSQGGKVVRQCRLFMGSKTLQLCDAAEASME